MYNKLSLYYKNQDGPGQYTSRFITLDDLSPILALDMNCFLPLDSYVC